MLSGNRLNLQIPAATNSRDPRRLIPDSLQSILGSVGLRKQAGTSREESQRGHRVFAQKLSLYKEATPLVAAVKRPAASDERARKSTASKHAFSHLAPVAPLPPRSRTLRGGDFSLEMVFLIVHGDCACFVHGLSSFSCTELNSF